MKRRVFLRFTGVAILACLANPIKSLKAIASPKAQIPGMGNPIKWPANIRWKDGEIPTLATEAGGMDAIQLIFDGNHYYGSVINNLK